MKNDVAERNTNETKAKDFSPRFSARKWYAYDFGTANMKILPSGKEPIERESATAEVDQHTGKLLEYGNAAQEMSGKTPEHISVFRPFAKSQVPSDVVGEMIRLSVKKKAEKSFLSPNFILSVPTGSTAQEKEEWLIQAKNGGAHHVALVEPIYAAALGAGWDPDFSRGFMIVDVGGSMTGIAVLSYGEIACSRFLPIGGDQFDQAIMRYVRKKDEALLRPEVAEMIKRTIGTIYDKTEETSLNDVRTLCAKKGTPKIISVSSSEMIEAMAEPATAIVDAVCSVVEQLSEVLLEDVLYSGMILTGGGSRLRGLDRLITRITGIPARVAERPEDCTVRGLARLMDPHRKFKNFSVTWY